MLVAALVALGLASLDARARLTDRLPSPLDWRALTALLERDARPGDLVAILPPWLERARLAVPARLPVLATSALEAEWLPGVRRVWLVAAERRHHPGHAAPAGRPHRLGRHPAAGAAAGDPARPGRAGAPAGLAGASGAAGRPAGGRSRGWPAAAWSCPRGPARWRASRCRPSPLGNALAGHAALLPPSSAGPARLLVQVDDGPPIPVVVGAGRRLAAVPHRHHAASPHASHSVTIEAEAPAGGALCLEALVLP